MPNYYLFVSLEIEKGFVKECLLCSMHSLKGFIVLKYFLQGNCIRWSLHFFLISGQSEVSQRKRACRSSVRSLLCYLNRTFGDFMVTLKPLHDLWVFQSGPFTCPLFWLFPMLPHSYGDYINAWKNQGKNWLLFSLTDKNQINSCLKG